VADSETLTEYDADLMRRQADMLYAEADRAGIMTMIVVGVIGVLIAGAAFNFLADRYEILAIVLSLAIPLGAALLGWSLGESRAIRLRAQAQQLLALVTIEMNTRKAAASRPHTAA